MFYGALLGLNLRRHFFCFHQFILHFWYLNSQNWMRTTIQFSGDTSVSRRTSGYNSQTEWEPQNPLFRGIYSAQSSVSWRILAYEHILQFQPLFWIFLLNECWSGREDVGYGKETSVDARGWPTAEERRGGCSDLLLIHFNQIFFNRLFSPTSLLLILLKIDR